MFWPSVNKAANRASPSGSNDTKSEIAQIENAIANAKTKVDAQKAIIKTISDAKADNIRSIQDKIASNSAEVDKTQSEVDALIVQINDLKNKIEGKEQIEEDIDKAK